ncbi:AraC family transcriptional regulator [Streptomyces sp. Je 1-4]|uniref:helix-turn-helix domain-containing protein n=1 Tax=Streptomyces TaxID=1883 RepID=UPI0021D7E4F8|nr:MULTISPECIES: AraC family transcriptional regulator [unclassified Streptomyces]UYB41165.1 AraC family transcriptional regulator [Streptomyces sp. Je 1-4]UZQ37340.1 AraC family transcriptional regulator [Streptomyces sp. Je 1-4] [Streptomyces sp. Je 1-4 4N24]UZQ44757.1 AraC family transcriptional regulator [Streptomyces sp. Je 1-4] [Streptomyces sp. Je 1-4 4N24_ara]
MTDGPPRTTISAWRPTVPGIAEVFHAHFTEHAYPSHTHDTWALMILNDGAVDFACDRHRHGAAGSGTVVLLPPGVAHDGRTVTAAGFRKRVLYLDATVLPEELTGRAVDGPVFGDELLRHRIHQLHTSLGHPGEGHAAAVHLDDVHTSAVPTGEAFEAESRLAFIRERLFFHLAALRPPRTPGREANRLAAALRDLLDARLPTGISLQEAAAVLHAHPTHLIRCFKQTYGLPPHTYLTGKRIERARGLLLDGRRPAEVAATVGFHDQAHLNRHFTRHVGTTPSRYAATRRRS